MSFTFTGGGGGSFSVSGTMPTTSANLGTVDWAAGYRDTPTTSVEVGGARTRGSGRYDLAAVTIPRVTVGSATINANCDPDVSTCAAMILGINFSEADENFDFICALESGSVAITEISSTRVKGTFTGSGTCISANFTSTTFTVTGGIFDVPLVATPPT